MNAKTIAAALALAALPAAGWATQFSIESSTNTQNLEEQLEQAADKSGQGASEVFDGSGGGKGGFQLRDAVSGFFRAAGKAAAILPKGLKTAAVPDVKEVLSDKQGKKQSNLDTLEVAPDGSMYRMRRTPHPWWQVWKIFDRNKIIEHAAAGDDGALFNKKGEFVGDWEVVMKTKADGFKVAADKATGKNTIFTFERNGSGTEIAKDGKYVTTLGGVDLREIKIGKDSKVYARYEKGADDVIVSIDPVTKAQNLVAKVKAEYKTWKEWVPEKGYYDEIGHYEKVWHAGTDGYYDSGGYWHEGSGGYYSNAWVHEYDQWVVTQPAHYETHTSRTGLTKFEVDGSGKVYTQFKGQVLNGKTGDVISADNVRNFNVDSKGTLFTVINNKLSVNNNEPLQAWGGDKALNVDDHGNLYGADGKMLRRTTVTPDPSASEAAPSALLAAAK